MYGLVVVIGSVPINIELLSNIDEIKSKTKHNEYSPKPYVKCKFFKGHTVIFCWWDSTGKCAKFDGN